MRQGRGRTLIEALEIVEARREGEQSQGRAGIAPPNLDNPQVNMTSRDRQDMG